MMELTKKDTKMMQGLSVLAMVWLHLFDTWNYEGLFKPLLFFHGFPFSLYIAQLSDFCVMGFAFCSGYAHFVLSQENDYYKRRLKSMLKLLIRYWTVLIVFTLISVLLGKQDYMPGSWGTFLQTIFLLNSGYNGAWWYLFSYIVIVLASPLLHDFVRKDPLWLTAAVCSLLYCVSYHYRFGSPLEGLLLGKLGPLGMTAVEYLMGSMAAKYRLFSFLDSIWIRFSRFARVIVSVSLTVIMLLVRTLLVPSLFVAPFTGIVVLSLFQLWKKPRSIESFFLWIGKHSTHIWLTHMFFYLYLFKGLVYIAVYPLLIFMFMIVITTVVSMMLEYIKNKTFQLLKI